MHFFLLIAAAGRRRGGRGRGNKMKRWRVKGEGI